MVPVRNFDNTVTKITRLPTRKSWHDFSQAESLNLDRDGMLS